MSIEVKSAIFRVEDGKSIFWVIKEIPSGAKPYFLCSCGATDKCSHIEAVISYIERWQAQSSKSGVSGDKDGIAIERVLIPSMNEEESRLPDEKRIEILRKTGSLLNKLLQIVVSPEPISFRKEEIARTIEEVIKNSERHRATDLLKSIAGLRKTVLAESIDPSVVCINIERVASALKIIERFVAGEQVEELLKTTYIGSSGMHEDVEVRQEVNLLEISRNSVLTPFGFRRSDSYYLCTDTGEYFIEENFHSQGVANPSRGPFPKKVKANLVTIQQALCLKRIKLLQYTVLPPPGDADIIKIKTSAFTYVEDMLRLYRKTVEIVGAPYPVFVVFVPIKVQFMGNRLYLKDSSNAAIALAYNTAPYGCFAVERLCRQSNLHVIAGLMVIEKGYVAIKPLSILTEENKNFRMYRIT